MCHFSSKGRQHYDVVQMFKRLVDKSELEEFRQTLKRVSGGNMTITSQNGCLKTHIKLNTPALK
jgi:hypothetical protein